MPNRLFQDSCRWSPTLDQLSLEATAMFYPLVMVADDFGCFDADPRLLLSLCFPLRADRITRDQVAGWRNEMVAAGLIELYGHNDHVYGHFVKWNQHHKPHNTSKRKYPEPKDGTPIVPGAQPQKRSPKSTRSHSGSLDLTRSHSGSLPVVVVEDVDVVEGVDAVAVEGEDKESTPSGGSEKPAAGPKGQEKTPGALVFEAYAGAYVKKYGVAPPRNKQANSACKHFAEKLPASEAPAVAAYYLTTLELLYVRSKHALTLMLRDAEKLWTEWKTGRRGAPTYSEKTAGNLAAAEAFLAKSGQTLND